MLSVRASDLRRFGIAQRDIAERTFERFQFRHGDVLHNVSHAKCKRRIEYVDARRTQVNEGRDFARDCPLHHIDERADIVLRLFFFGVHFFGIDAICRRIDRLFDSRRERAAYFEMRFYESCFGFRARAHRRLFGNAAREFIVYVFFGNRITVIHRRNIFKNGTGFHAESMQEKRKICNALPRGRFEFILIKFIKMTKGEVSPSLSPASLRKRKIIFSACSVHAVVRCPFQRGHPATPRVRFISGRKTGSALY